MIPECVTEKILELRENKILVGMYSLGDKNEEHFVVEMNLITSDFKQNSSQAMVIAVMIRLQTFD